MAAGDKLIFDSWTPMSFKRVLGNRKSPGRSWEAPTWVDYHARRLQAYTVLNAYLDNAARHFLGVTEQVDMDDHREYGDAALIRNTALSALLGEDQRIATDGSEGFDPEFDPEDEGAAEEDVAYQAEAERALELQAWLEQWADDERFQVKLQECERDAVGLGDGVYTIGWSERKGRPRLRVFDPGFYFPVLDDSSDDFPNRVHIAWEMPVEEGKPGVRVRRITWELGPIEAKVGPDGDVLLDSDETFDETGAVVRSYPWNDDPSPMTCYMTDAVWTLEGGASHVEDFTQATAEYMTNESGDELDRIDLGIDFVPVVHISNTISVKEHYGRSVMLHVLQILDDLSNADTDLSAASATTGTPPIALGGSTLGEGKLSYKPGSVFEIGDGRMDVLDTSNSLDALLKYIDSLWDRLSINARLPDALLGRINPGDVPSGIALALSFGPLSSMIREMRMARDEKYVLIFKFVQRIGQAAGMDGVPDYYIPTRLVFGSFLPADQSAAISAVTQLLTAKAISTETAVTILMDAGFPIDDALEEVQRIQGRDFAGANELLDATGDQDQVNSYLGREDAVSIRPEPPLDEPPVEDDGSLN